MLINFLTVAWRNFIKDKVNSFINVTGLSLGLACSLMIYLWVSDELSYDQFHQNGKRLYKVLADAKFSNGQSQIMSHTPANLAPALGDQLPEIAHTIRFSPGFEDKYLFMYDEQSSNEKGCYTDKAFFQMFSFPFIAGKPANALDNINSIVISGKLASKYFKGENPLGKTITIKYKNGKQNYMVSGVFEDIPVNSSLQFDFVIPYQDLQKRNEWLTKWGSISIQTYIQLQEDVTAGEIEPKMGAVLKTHCKDCSYELFLQPFEQLYLQSDYKADRNPGGRIEYIRLFSVIALVVLLIACINFMNLSTARAGTRAREVGVRKVIGAGRKSLVIQFLGESLLVASVAMLLAVFMVQLLLPAFNALTQKNMQIPFADPAFICALLGLTAITGILAGSYPSFVLSSFQPISVLKGTLVAGKTGSWLRKGLVTFQFTLATLLPICTLVVYQQINYIRHKNLGLDRENLFYIPVNEYTIKNFERFRAQALANAPVQAIALADQNPLTITNRSPDARWEGKSPDDNTNFFLTVAGYDYIRTLGIQIKEGRDYSREMATDSVNYIINEEAARRMGMKNPVGQPLHFWRGPGQIVGVVKDFHHQSMHTPIEPLIMMLWPQQASLILVRTKAGKTQEALTALEKIHKEFSPEYPFEYHFLEAEFDKLYKSETLTSQMAGYFTMLALFISCIGLFGLVSLSTSQKMKEIGVRKVLGASVPDILLLLSRDFIQLILLANVVAWLLAYWGTKQWLQHFAFHISISPWLFLLPSLLVLLIAMLTVNLQSLKAALTNPVKVLRNE